jgi:hypothetical protein
MVINSRRIKWAGYVKRIGKKRNEYRIVSGREICREQITLMS